ncbi:MAG: transcriptional repressor [Bacteroidota bacterium]
MRTAENILQSHKLRRTQSRIQILELFLAGDAALSEPDLERKMNGQCDRVTIYRTLTSFMDNGVLHKVLDDSGVMKYALCSRECGETHAHHHDHLHFKCEVCGLTTCVEEIKIPQITLPEGYVQHSINVLVEGRCPKCSV